MLRPRYVLYKLKTENYYINSIESEKVRLKIIDDNSPALIVPENDDSYIYLAAINCLIR
jgi:hypothetical protein